MATYIIQERTDATTSVDEFWTDRHEFSNEHDARQAFKDILTVKRKGSSFVYRLKSDEPFYERQAAHVIRLVHRVDTVIPWERPEQRRIKVAYWDRYPDEDSRSFEHKFSSVGEARDYAHGKLGRWPDLDTENNEATGAGGVVCVEGCKIADLFPEGPLAHLDRAQNS